MPPLGVTLMDLLGYIKNKIKVTNKMTFRRDIILDYNCEPNLIILLLKSRDLSSVGRRKSGRAILKQRIPHKVVALKMKGVT